MHVHKPQWIIFDDLSRKCQSNAHLFCSKMCVGSRKQLQNQFLFNKPNVRLVYFLAGLQSNTKSTWGEENRVECEPFPELIFQNSISSSLFWKVFKEFKKYFYLTTFVSNLLKRIVLRSWLTSHKTVRLRADSTWNLRKPFSAHESLFSYFVQQLLGCISYTSDFPNLLVDGQCGRLCAVKRNNREFGRARKYSHFGLRRRANPTLLRVDPFRDSSDAAKFVEQICLWIKPLFWWTWWTYATSALFVARVDYHSRLIWYRFSRRRARQTNEFLVFCAQRRDSISRMTIIGGVVVVCCRAIAPWQLILFDHIEQTLRWPSGIYN